MQTKYISSISRLIRRPGGTAQLFKGEALCNSCYTVLLTLNISRNRLPPACTYREVYVYIFQFVKER